MAVMTRTKTKAGGDLQAELDALRDQLALTNDIDEIGQLQTRERALIVAIEREQAAQDKQRNQAAIDKINEQRDQLKELEKVLDREALALLRRSYALYDDILEQLAKAQNGRSLANSNPDHLTFEHIRPAGTVIAILQHQLYGALINIEAAYPEFWKRSKHKHLTPGFDR